MKVGVFGLLFWLSLWGGLFHFAFEAGLKAALEDPGWIFMNVMMGVFAILSAVCLILRISRAKRVKLLNRKRRESFTRGDDKRPRNLHK